MKHLAFVSSSIEYTQGIFPFVRRLTARGYLVCWISFRGYERHWLLAHGVPPELILDTLAGFNKVAPSEEIDARLAQLECSQPPYANQIISMDRLLKLKDDQFARSYLAHIQESVTSFLLDHSIALVSGGRDTALQIATSRICRTLGIGYVVPTVARIPDDRYGFCQGHTEADFIATRGTNDDDRGNAAQFLQQFREKRPIPTTVDFERRNNQFLRRIPKDMRLVLTMAYRGIFDLENDFTRYTVGQLFGMYWRRRWNALCVGFVRPFRNPKSKPFVLYAYQMQPESSIDVLASQYSDQITLVRQIARSIPSSHDFYVKPHPDHVGGLSCANLIEIGRIPGVTLVDPFASGRELMHRAAVVITPAGTMAYEAALHGIPSIVFAEQFYGRLPTVHRCLSIDTLPELICNLLAEPPQRDDNAILEYLANLFANTFSGRNTSYFGPFTDAELTVMEGAYDQLYDGFSRRG